MYCSMILTLISVSVSCALMFLGAVLAIVLSASYFRLLHIRPSSNDNGHRSHTDKTTKDETSFMGYPNPMQRLIPTSLLTRSF